MPTAEDCQTSMAVNSAEPNLIEQYKDVFGEIGCLKEEYHININPEV